MKRNSNITMKKKINNKIIQDQQTFHSPQKVNQKKYKYSLLLMCMEIVQADLTRSKYTKSIISVVKERVFCDQIICIGIKYEVARFTTLKFDSL